MLYAGTAYNVDMLSGQTGDLLIRACSLIWSNTICLFCLALNSINVTRYNLKVRTSGSDRYLQSSKQQTPEVTR